MQDSQDNQLALIPDLPATAKKRVVTALEVDRAVLMLSEYAQQCGWKDIERYDDSDNKRLRDRLREQRVIDGKELTGEALLGTVLDIIAADDFLCNRKRHGMSVDWIIGRDNFKKICIGRLGRRTNAKPRVSRITQAFLGND